MPVRLAASFSVDPLPGAQEGDYVLLLEGRKLDLDKLKGIDVAILQQPNSRRDEVFDAYVRFTRTELRLLMIQLAKFCAAEDIGI